MPQKASSKYHSNCEYKKKT